MKYDLVIIGGCGRVGLPLGLAFADRGLNVGLIDIDEDRKAILAQGKMPFLEEGGPEVLSRVFGKTLHLASPTDIADSDCVIITVGTPTDEYLNPRLLPILKLGEQIFPYLRNEQTVILRSTVYPGTSQKLYDFFKAKGKEIHVCFCPERILQGHALEELHKLPQIISGTGGLVGIWTAEKLFQKLQHLTITLTTLEAELLKLFSNAYRYIQFAAANQFYEIAKANGADFGKIREAMMLQYERCRDFPKAGFAAGPCLLKDTMQLAAFTGNQFPIGDAAMRINEGMPRFIVDQLGDVEFNTVGILGMCFKPDVDDIRDSLSYKLGKILRFEGANVLYSDEYINDPTFISKEELIDRCETIIIATEHAAYKALDFKDRHVIRI